MGRVPHSDSSSSFPSCPLMAPTGPSAGHAELAIQGARVLRADGGEGSGACGREGGGGGVELQAEERVSPSTPLTRQTLILSTSESNRECVV